MSLPSWEEDPFPSGLKDALLDILIRSESDHAVIIKAVSCLSGSSETFWRRTEIKLDGALAQAFRANKNWSFYPMSYLSCIPSADETKPPTILQVDADFLDQVIAHARSSNNIGGKFGALADYLTRTAPIHRNIAVLERLAVVQLRKYSEGGLYRDPGDAAVRLTEIARQRRLLDLNAPPLMLALKNDADVWRESLKDLIQRFVMHRSDELAKLESILTSEGLVSALADTMPKNEYCDFVTQLLAHSNLRDPAVFKMLLTSVESALRADPRRDWIVCVETRLNRNLYVENIPIETMAQAFLDSLPNKG